MNIYIVDRSLKASKRNNVSPCAVGGAHGDIKATTKHPRKGGPRVTSLRNHKFTTPQIRAQVNAR